MEFLIIFVSTLSLLFVLKKKSPSKRHIEDQIENFDVYRWFLKLGGDENWIQKRISVDLQEEIRRKKQEVFCLFHFRQSVDFYVPWVEHIDISEFQTPITIIYETGGFFITAKCNEIIEQTPAPNINDDIRSLEEYHGLIKEKRTILKNNILKKLLENLGGDTSLLYEVDFKVDELKNIVGHS